MRTWMESIENGTIIYMAYALMLLVPSIVLPIMATKKVNVLKFAANQVFAFYMCCLFALVFLPLPTTGTVIEVKHTVQWVPFMFVADFIREGFDFGVILQYVFNIVMTIPFGMYLRYYWKLDLKKIFFCSLALTSFIEIGQLTGLFFLYPGSYRFCDVDDIIANTLGGVLGCLMVQPVLRFLPNLDRFDVSLEKIGMAFGIVNNHSYRVAGVRRQSMLFLKSDTSRRYMEFERQ